jgi:AcrR family transcriptional regulator
MARKRDYHHGNLREALIEAGIALLDQVGWDGMTLRACAARAGVSHAAPAHHFGNLKGLQTALGVVAFTRFRETLAAAQEVAGRDPKARLRAAGEGYVRFATAHPGLFRLMFGGAELDRSDPALADAQDSAYGELGRIVAPFLPAEAGPEDDHRLRLAVWSMAHGYAHLLLAGQLRMMGVSEDGLSHLPDLSCLIDATGARVSK